MAGKVLVADDSVFMRNLLKQFPEGEHEVVGGAESGVEAAELYHELGPDVVTVDVMTPIWNDIGTTSETKSPDVGASVIVYTSVGQEEKMHETVEARTGGYIMKPSQGPNVSQAIADVIQAEA